jgi:predicted transcriptional regulator of viral defense system
MLHSKSAAELLLRLARRRSIFTAADAAGSGIHSQELSRAMGTGLLERVARGQYRLAGRPVTENHALTIAARAVPHGVICLLSAVAFHGIGTQLPFEVWIAVERGARAPSLRYPTLRIARFSGPAFDQGIEIHRLEGQPVRIYSVAKTVADLFKYRKKIGLDVAMEALREVWRDRRATIDEIDHFARICRVERVMRPYLEALVA